MLWREFCSQIKEICPKATFVENKEGELIIGTGKYIVCDDNENDFVVADEKPKSVIVTDSGIHHA